MWDFFDCFLLHAWTQLLVLSVISCSIWTLTRGTRLVIDPKGIIVHGKPPRTSPSSLVQSHVRIEQWLEIEHKIQLLTKLLNGICGAYPEGVSACSAGPVPPQSPWVVCSKKLIWEGCAGPRAASISTYLSQSMELQLQAVALGTDLLPSASQWAMQGKKKKNKGDHFHQLLLYILVTSTDQFLKDGSTRIVS